MIFDSVDDRRSYFFLVRFFHPSHWILDWIKMCKIFQRCWTQFLSENFDLVLFSFFFSVFISLCPHRIVNGMDWKWAKIAGCVSLRYVVIWCGFSFTGRSIGFMYQLTRFFLAKRVALCLKEAYRSLSIDRTIAWTIDRSIDRDQVYRLFEHVSVVCLSLIENCMMWFESVVCFSRVSFYPELKRQQRQPQQQHFNQWTTKSRKKEKKNSFRWMVTIAELANEWSIDRLQTHRTTITITIKWELVAWVFVHFKCLSFFIINDQRSSSLSPSRAHTHTHISSDSRVITIIFALRTIIVARPLFLSIFISFFLHLLLRFHWLRERLDCCCFFSSS